jgi:hypothetical protein
LSQDSLQRRKKERERERVCVRVRVLTRNKGSGNDNIHFLGLLAEEFHFSLDKFFRHFLGISESEIYVRNIKINAKGEFSPSRAFTRLFHFDFQKLRTKCEDLLLHSSTSVKASNNRTQTLGSGNGRETSDTSSNHKNLCRWEFTGS